MMLQMTTERNPPISQKFDYSKCQGTHELCKENRTFIRYLHRQVIAKIFEVHAFVDFYDRAWTRTENQER